MTVSDGIIIRGIEIAQKKLREVLSGIDEVQNPKVYRNAYSMPLFFYMEKSIEKASKTARKLEVEYNASVVWMGSNKFIIVKDGTETVIEV